MTNQGEIDSLRWASEISGLGDEGMIMVGMAKPEIYSAVVLVVCLFEVGLVVANKQVRVLDEGECRMNVIHEE